MFFIIQNSVCNLLHCISSEFVTRIQQTVALNLNESLPPSCAGIWTSVLLTTINWLSTTLPNSNLNDEKRNIKNIIQFISFFSSRWENSVIELSKNFICKIYSTAWLDYRFKKCMKTFQDWTHIDTCEGLFTKEMQIFNVMTYDIVRVHTWMIVRVVWVLETAYISLSNCPNCTAKKGCGKATQDYPLKQTWVTWLRSMCLFGAPNLYYRLRKKL